MGRMSMDFGQLIQARRAEIRLTLRDCAVRAGMDPGNLSRLERGRVAPPQDSEILQRLTEALELTSSRAQDLMDVAAMQNGRIPPDIISNEEVMSALPILLRTVNNRQLDGAQVDKLIELIKTA